MMDNKSPKLGEKVEAPSQSIEKTPKGEESLIADPHTYSFDNESRTVKISPKENKADTSIFKIDTDKDFAITMDSENFIDFNNGEISFSILLDPHGIVSTYPKLNDLGYSAKVVAVKDRDYSLKIERITPKSTPL